MIEPFAKSHRKLYGPPPGCQPKLNSMEEGLEKAIEKAGGIRPLARLLGISAAAVSQWRQVPSRHVISIERLTGIPREILRPDLYPPRTPLEQNSG
jgi:DNA-binding transcriptional regulator YdaS (Cro superfamily)